MQYTAQFYVTPDLLSHLSFSYLDHWHAVGLISDRHKYFLLYDTTSSLNSATIPKILKQVSIEFLLMIKWTNIGTETEFDLKRTFSFRT